MKGANRRLFTRLLILLLVGVVATYFRRGYERDGLLWMFFAEMTVYFVALIAFLNTQTGRLKSRPETGKVSGTALFQEDPVTRASIAVYLFLLMLFVGSLVFRGKDIDPGPWQIFVALCPILLIVFVRQYWLERQGESD